MTAYHRSAAAKANISAGVLAWWAGRRQPKPDPEEPPAAPLAIGAIVWLTGTAGERQSRRSMRVTCLRQGSARCEWTHGGRQHADWFAVSGLRRGPA